MQIEIRNEKAGIVSCNEQREGVSKYQILSVVMIHRTFYVSCWEIASPNILKISQHVSPNFLVLRTVNFNNLVADNQTTCVQTPRELKLVNQAGHRPGIGARSIKGAQEWVVLQTWANLYLR